MTAFRLERVLRVRTQLRRLHALQAEMLATEVDTLRVREDALAAARDRCGVEEARTAAGGVAAAVVQLARAYDTILAREEQHVHDDGVRAAAALTAKRGEVEYERREERKLEQLEAMHRERAAEEEGRATAVLLDELALLQHARARGGRS